jgi:hypothetical protein
LSPTVSLRANKRDSTRITFPSTKASTLLKAMEAMAPAVYGPTPSIDLNSETVPGIIPSKLSRTFCAPDFDHYYGVLDVRGHVNDRVRK